MEHIVSVLLKTLIKMLMYNMYFYTWFIHSQIYIQSTIIEYQACLRILHIFSYLAVMILPAGK